MDPVIIRSWLRLFEELSSASLFTLILIFGGLAGYGAYKLRKEFKKFARKCGVQKQLLVGEIQRAEGVTPSEAIKLTNDRVEELLRIGG